MPARPIHRNITTNPPPTRPVLPLREPAPVPSRWSQWAGLIRGYLARMKVGLSVGTTVGVLTGPVLGAASGVLYFPVLFVAALVRSLFTGDWSGWGSGGGDMGGFILFLLIAAPYGAVIGLIPGLVMGALIGVVAALLRGRRLRATVGTLLGAALSVLLFGMVPLAGVLFILSGGIGGYRVAIAVDRKIQGLPLRSP
jgi:hypothetical protein